MSRPRRTEIIGDLPLAIDETFAQPYPIRWLLIDGGGRGRPRSEQKSFGVLGVVASVRWGLSLVRVQLAVVLNDPQTMRCRIFAKRLRSPIWGSAILITEVLNHSTREQLNVRSLSRSKGPSITKRDG